MNRMAVPTIFIALFVGFATVILLCAKGFWFAAKRLPPGPRPLPLLGNLLLLKKSSSIHALANELRQTYGSIFTLWLGSTPAIFISGPEVIQEAMIKQGHVFMGRAQYKSTAIISYGHRGLLSGIGERHRFFRKLLVSEVLSQSRLREFRPTRDKEIAILIQSLKKQASENGGVVPDFSSSIRLTVFSMIFDICFGRRLNLDQYMEMDAIMLRRFEIALGRPRDFIPVLRFLPDRKDVDEQWKMRKAISEMLQPLIEERRQILASGKGSEKKTLVDSLLELQAQSVKSGPETIEITDVDIEAFCLDTLNAATDTTAINLVVAIGNLVNHPHIQEKLFQEIVQIAGREAVDEDDISKMPYLQAVEKEALRRHTPARLSPSRMALAPTKVAGYDIPTNALVYQYLEAIAMNPDIWENPLEFWPERFIDRNVDVTGSSEVSFVPFGVGRRMCPAVNVAFLHGHLLLARLVQAFQWRSATPGELLDLSPTRGLTSNLKKALAPLVQER